MIDNVVTDNTDRQEGVPVRILLMKTGQGNRQQFSNAGSIFNPSGEDRNGASARLEADCDMCLDSTLGCENAPALLENNDCVYPDDHVSSEPNLPSGDQVICERPGCSGPVMALHLTCFAHYANDLFEDIIQSKLISKNVTCDRGSDVSGCHSLQNAAASVFPVMQLHS